MTARRLLPAIAVMTTARAVFAAPPPPDPQVFAIIVANNKSREPERPDLQFADDDGARYYRLLSNAGGDARAVLLGSFDRATAMTYPDLASIARAPTRADLVAAVDDIAAAVAAARREGRRTAFYFVFAGHGDVAGGFGYLELEDARIDGAFLEEQIIDRIPADVDHVILDSCNSFFVLNPRRPGGRRWATPRDMSNGFAQRHPNVGAFLSTSAEAEVYEWSELESGIFSHEVRSGLSGAADADGDGVVTYGELAAFVERANERLPSDAVRPRVFQRGPGGATTAPLLASARIRGRVVTIGAGERRVWLRGESGQRLIDLHKEEPPVRIVVPGDPQAPLMVVEQRQADAKARPALWEYEVPAGAARVDLAALEAHPPATTPRGGTPMFGHLFELPYGPRAYAELSTAQEHQPEPVFGLGHADELRMRHYLTAIADEERSLRLTKGTTNLVVGGLFVGSGLYMYAASSQFGLTSGDRLGYLAGFSSLGLLFAVPGLLELGTTSPGEQGLATFERELRVPGASRANVVARTEEALDLIAQRDRFERKFWRWTGALASGLALTMGTVALVRGDTNTPAGRDYVAAMYGTSALTGGMTVALFFTPETRSSRLLRLYRTDPDLETGSSLHVGLAPLPGGGAIGLSGRF
jgi:hypothetical protein